MDAPTSHGKSPDLKLVRVPGVRSRELESGEIALLGSDEQQLILLNAVGAAVWDLCCGSSSQKEIVEALQAHFTDVAREQIEANVERFVEQLMALRVLNRTTVSDEETT